ncbi:MAG TPA: thr operon leader peptide [Nitrosopumilaceae archaeon]|jgi:hypothetical protein|nr:thr operon leader peptide [Nitrosopumilaceae archaeon]
MDKYSIITLISIIVIIGSVSYGVWGIYSVEQLQLRTPNTEFRYFEMANYETMEMCNPMSFFTSFDALRIEAYYTNDLKGVFEIGSTTINPNTSKVIDIQFSSENFAESQYLFMHMDGQFEDELPIRLDPSKMIMVTNFETKIIGIIPYQSTITQSGLEFTKMMNEDSRCEESD